MQPRGRHDCARAGGQPGRAPDCCATSLVGVGLSAVGRCGSRHRNGRQRGLDWPCRPGHGSSDVSAGDSTTSPAGARIAQITSPAVVEPRRVSSRVAGHPAARVPRTGKGSPGHNARPAQFDPALAAQSRPGSQATFVARAHFRLRCFPVPRQSALAASPPPQRPERFRTGNESERPQPCRPRLQGRCGRFPMLACCSSPPTVAIGGQRFPSRIEHRSVRVGCLDQEFGWRRWWRALPLRRCRADLDAVVPTWNGQTLTADITPHCVYRSPSWLGSDAGWRDLVPRPTQAPLGPENRA